MQYVTMAFSGFTSAAQTAASTAFELAQEQAGNIRKAVQVAPQAIRVLREVQNFVNSDEVQIRLSDRYRVAAWAILFFVISALFTVVKFLRNFVNTGYYTLALTLIFATITGAWILVDRNFKTNLKSLTKFLFTVSVSQASLLIWGLLTTLTLRAYGNHGSVWEMVLITLMFPMTLFSNFLASQHPESEAQIHRTVKNLAFVLPTLAAVSHIVRMVVSTFGAKDGVSTFMVLICVFDTIKLITTKTLMVIFLWFSAQTTEQKARDVTQIVMSAWTALMSYSTFRAWWEEPITQIETSKSVTRAFSGIGGVMTSFRKILKIAVDEVGDDDSHLRMRRISLGCYVVEDGYYFAVVVLRSAILALMTSIVFAKVGYTDPRACLVVLFLAFQIFWGLRNKPPTMAPFVVMVVRNKHYIDVVAGITVAFKIRTAYLGGELEALSEDEQCVVEEQIHARLSPDLAKKVMRLRPVSHLCVALYQQYVQHQQSQTGEIDYTRLGQILLTSAPGLIQYWYAEETVEDETEDGADAAGVEKLATE
jgi:hypothetical protein